MSRRSLRLDDGLLDRSLPHTSASFSVGGTAWRSSRLLKCHRSQQFSVSCSDSLLLTAAQKSNGLRSDASDASLLSSLVDDSSIQENTLVDSFWGLDHDMDPKESTIIGEQTTVLADRTLMGSDDCGPKQPVQTISRFYCQDFEPNPDRKDSTYCPSSSSSCMMVPGLLEPKDSETSIYCRERKHRPRTARSRRCGVMNLKEASINQRERHPNGALCKTAVDVCRWASRRTHHLTSSLQACFPMRILLVLPLLLLLFSLCWFGPAALHCLLPAINITELSTTVSGSVYDVICSQSQSTEGALEERRGAQPHEKLLCWGPPLEEVAEDESARLIRLEQSVTALWEQVEAGGRWAEQRHREVLQLYAELRQEKQQRDGDGVWLTSLMEQQLEHFRTQLDKERQQEEQTQQQHQMSRVDELELQLQTLAAQTEELQQKQGAVTSSLTSLPADVRVGVEHQSHDTLLAEVARLEAILEDIRQEVASLSACHDSCKRLDNIQEAISDQVSAQVRDEVRTQVYGNQMVRGGTSAETAPPESLLQWLSQHYVSGTEMQAELSSLELRVLQNISQQLEQYRGEDAAGDSTGIVITQKDVHVIVEDALRRFSQDKTSMADYALESGGGSILSTRCSETYKTKTALLSLFGFPLWYFSQSPRAVIQPDVHLGNCWAFKGSKGFLVIRLSMQIFPTAFSLEHIPKVLSPSRMLHSAPREFSVYGLDDDNQERGELLGSFTYDQDGEALQTFAITEDCNRLFQIIEVQVLSNWGHPDYTCMYRFRVHGTPAVT